ncbi:hypothetical protein BOTBODRAFT_39935 [Botryobasidium botryosum FD-172 SS1]|uniref:Uncharacterized protein n=1 Tax=Botryobasidium botryosum (strain FD-172 SS1) TaxID=930990 RepID=A0A067LRP7_BOTB1|nr:hypothetical protein BOTBODRAFT_39935 [Botryobasidium botryosum FD-172 SS1]
MAAVDRSAALSRRFRRCRHYFLVCAPFSCPRDIWLAFYASARFAQECNSTTDNPFIDGEMCGTHRGGNLQAAVVANAMEKTWLSLFHCGKTLFAQPTKLLNPAFNHSIIQESIRVSQHRMEIRAD